MKVRFLGGRSYSPDAAETLGFVAFLPDHVVLVECGQYVPLELERSGIGATRPSVVYVSHDHADHIGGLPWLLFANIMERFYGRTEPGGELLLAVPQAAQSPMLQYCLATYPLVFGDSGPVHAHVKDPLAEPIRVGAASLQSFPLDHPVASYGLMLRHGDAAVAYVPDTAPVDELPGYVRGANTLICAVAEPTGQRQVAERFKFLTAADTGKLAADAGAARLILMHVFFPEDEDRCVVEAKKVFGGEVVVATPGLEVDVL